MMSSVCPEGKYLHTHGGDGRGVVGTQFGVTSCMSDEMADKVIGTNPGFEKSETKPTSHNHSPSSDNGGVPQPRHPHH